MSPLANVIVSILFDGLAYAMFLFITSVGLPVTMGLMGFVNLAHGVFAMFGARMADGCPSGHGLSGMMQLSMSSFVALGMFFGAGVAVAALVYGRRSS